MREYISAVIKNKLPGFLKSEYRELYLILVHYFEFLENEGNPLDILENISAQMDVNQEDLFYSKKILSELGFDPNLSIQIPIKELIHHLRDFYLSRGSLRSFQFLFRLLYNSSITIQYPRERMLICSEAEYSGNIYIYTTVTSRDTIPYYRILEKSKDFSLVIEGSSSKTRSNIETISLHVTESNSYLRIQIDKTITPFIPYEGVEIRDNEGNRILESIIGCVSFDIVNGGSGYQEGETFTVNGCSIQGSGRILTYKGGILNIGIVSGGSGYQEGDAIFAEKTKYGHSFSARVKSVDSSGKITSLEVMSPGYDYEVIPRLFIKTVAGGNAALQIIGSDIGRIKSLQFIEYPAHPINIASVSISINTVSGTGAMFTPRISAVYMDTPKHRNQVGILGVNGILTDSYYYQQFSYEIGSNISRDTYDSIVNSWVHPVGYVRFSSFKNTFIGSLWEDSVIPIETSLQLSVLKIHLSVTLSYIFNPMYRYAELSPYWKNNNDTLSLYTNDEKYSSLYEMSEALETVITRRFVLFIQSYIISNMSHVEVLKSSPQFSVSMQHVGNETVNTLTDDRILPYALETRITIL